MKKLLCIVGPTAVGKTDLAFELSSELNAALISADSVQVYQGLDIISGKDLPEGAKFQSLKGAEFKLEKKITLQNYSLGFYQLSNGTKIYLLDIVHPAFEFSVFDFKTVFNFVFRLISQKKEMPILVGGTGFYIDSLFGNIDTIAIPQDENLRRELEMLSLELLQRLLHEKDPDKLENMNNSDLNNKRRLIRAIEVAKFKKRKNLRGKIVNKNLDGRPNAEDRFWSWFGGTPFENTQGKQHRRQDDNILFIGLKAPRKVLKSRIDSRVEKRLEQGALAEAKSLFENYENLANQVKTANGYRQLFEYLKENSSLEKAVENWKRAEYLNAKNQMTWFGRNKKINWFDITQDHFQNDIRKLVKSWYNEEKGTG